MANQNSKVFNIDLKGELITTQNKNIIKQFTGFKERNCLVANNSLKSFKKNNTPFIYDDNGNYYSLENDKFKINGVVEKTVATNSPFIVKTEIPVTYENLNNVIWAVPYASGTKEYKIIQTSSNINIYEKTESQWTLRGRHTGVFTILTSKRCLVFSNISSTAVKIFVIYNDKVFYKSFATDTGYETDKGINFTIKNNQNNVPYFIFKTCSKNFETFSVYNDGLLVSPKSIYFFDLNTGTNSGIISSSANNYYLFFEGDYVVNLSTLIYWPIFITTNYTPNATDTLEYDEDWNCWVSQKASHFGTLSEKGRASFTFNSNTTTLTIGDYQNAMIEPCKSVYNENNKYSQYDNIATRKNPNTDMYCYLIQDSPEFYLNFFNYSNALVIVSGDNIVFSRKSFLKTVKTKLVGYDQGSLGFYPYSTAEAAIAAAQTQITSGTGFTMSLQSSDSTLQDTSLNNTLYLGDGKIIFNSGNSFDNLNYIREFNSSFDIVYNSGKFANLSWTTKIFEPFFHIDDTYCPPIWSESKQGFYYLINNKWYLVTENQNTGYIEYVLDRYILLNVKLADGDVFNLYDTQTQSWLNYATDWDNRIIVGYDPGSLTPTEITSSNYNISVFDMELASGINVNYAQGNITSAIFNPVILSDIMTLGWGNVIINNSDLINLLHLDFKTGYKYFIELYFSTTLLSAQLENPPYIANYNGETTSILSILQGRTYPTETGGNIILNVPLTVNYVVSSFSIYYIFTNNIYYQLNTNNDEIILNYDFTSGLTNITEMFTLQGNSYIIRNNIISSCTFIDGMLQNVQAIISCKNLVFMGTNVSTAFFYSPANKKILGFTGNRDFIDLAEFTEIETIYKYAYSINFKTFFILSNIGCICIADEGYVSIIKDSVYNNFILYSKSFGLFNAQTSLWDIFSLYENGNKVPVSAKTAFYGYGNNQVTIIDTWYLKLYAETPCAGNIRLKVVSLTDEGIKSEETNLIVSKDMWDEVTHSYYLRYQPKLQRGIGLSLEIESDFDIYEINCSANPDTTIQLSKPFASTNVIKGGKI